MATAEKKRYKLVICNEKLVISVDVNSGKIESSLGRAVLPVDLQRPNRGNSTSTSALFPWQVASLPTAKKQTYEFGDCFVATEGDSDSEILACAQYNAALDGIESLILAHAVAGVNVEAPAYIQGIEKALRGLGKFLE